MDLPECIPHGFQQHLKFRSKSSLGLDAQTEAHQLVAQQKGCPQKCKIIDPFLFCKA